MPQELLAAAIVARELPSWTVEDRAIVRTDVAGSFPAAIAWVVAVGEVAEEMNHHPDIDIRHSRVTWRLTTHSAGGITGLDVALAHRIHAIVSQHAGDNRHADVPHEALTITGDGTPRPS